MQSMRRALAVGQEVVSEAPTVRILEEFARGRIQSWLRGALEEDVTDLVGSLSTFVPSEFSVSFGSEFFSIGLLLRLLSPSADRSLDGPERRTAAMVFAEVLSRHALARLCCL